MHRIHLPSIPFFCNVFLGKTKIGFLGTLNDAFKNHYDIKRDISVCEISLNLLKDKCKLISYQETPQYPSVKRDISLLISKAFLGQDIIDYIFNQNDALLINVNIFDIYEGEKIEEGKKSISVSLHYQSLEKTLIDKEVDDRLSDLVEKLNKKFGVIQR